jgi:hypothetical protein
VFDGHLCRKSRDLRECCFEGIQVCIETLGAVFHLLYAS